MAAKKGEDGFVQSARRLSEEIHIPNAVVEEQMRDFSSRVNAVPMINLDQLQIDQIKERLDQHEDGVHAAEAIRDQERENAKIARYLEDTGRTLKDERPELDALRAVFGEPQKAPLSEEDKQEVERFLLGDAVYTARRDRAIKKYDNQIPEHVRTQTLLSFLKGVKREGYRAPNPEAYWQDKVGPAQKLKESALEGLAFSAYMPMRTLADFLAKQASEDFLLRSLPKGSKESVSELLNLENAKAEIARIAPEASDEERARKIRSVVDELSRKVFSTFPYEIEARSLARIVEQKEANCLGYAVIGSLLLRGLGISSALATAKGHAFVGYTLPDKRFYVNHFQHDKSYQVTNDDLDNQNPDDAALFLNDPSRMSMNLRLSVGTPMVRWRKENIPFSYQEGVCLYKNIEPALMAWIHGRSVEQVQQLPSERFVGRRNIIEARLTDHEREALVKALEQNPDDPRLLEILMEVEPEDVFGNSTSGAQWARVVSNAKVSKEGLKQYSFIGKVKRGLRRLFMK